MKKETLILILAGILGFAAALAWRHVATTTPRPAATDRGETAEPRIAAYEASIEALSAFDPALIRYHETVTLQPDGLDALTAIAIDADDRIYVGGGDTVVVLDAQGVVLRRFTVDGTISCLAVDSDTQLYVGLGDTVQAVDQDGRPLTTFRDLPPRAIITSLAATDDAVFVADARSRTVMRFTPNGTLEQVNDGTVGGTDPTGFVIPSPCFDIVPGQDGTLWVVNPGRHRLEEYNHNAERIRVWDERPGLAIEAFCGCCNPAHIARLADGTLVTSEKGLPRIKLYAPRGAFIGVVAGPQAFDGHDLMLDLAVDSRDRILVADAARRQVRIFERKADRP